MSPSEYFLKLQKGITGGFAPPTPELIYTVTREKDSDTLQVTHTKRQIGEPELGDLNSNTRSHHEAKALVTELHGILKVLPMEDPPGSEDIYGLDTSIAWGSDDLEWYNGGPTGCNGQPSSTQVTNEQKEKFKRAVNIVRALVEMEGK